MLQEHSPHPVALDAFNQGLPVPPLDQPTTVVLTHHSCAVNHTIKHELIKLRHHWNKHEPRMFDRVKHLSDDVLTGWDLERDLVTVRSGPIAYGVILLGKASDTCLFSCPAVCIRLCPNPLYCHASSDSQIRIPGVQDARGEGFVHVRLVAKVTAVPRGR